MKVKFLKVLMAAVLSVSLVFGLNPVTSYAGPSTHPVCSHTNIGCSSGTTMYYMNRVTYVKVPIYNFWGTKITGYYTEERDWYKCSLCGYETYVAFRID